MGGSGKEGSASGSDVIVFVCSFVCLFVFMLIALSGPCRELQNMQFSSCSRRWAEEPNFRPRKV